MDFTVNLWLKIALPWNAGGSKMWIFLHGDQSYRDIYFYYLKIGLSSSALSWQFFNHRHWQDIEDASPGDRQSARAIKPIGQDCSIGRNIFPCLLICISLVVSQYVHEYYNKKIAFWKYLKDKFLVSFTIQFFIQ